MKCQKCERSVQELRLTAVSSKIGRNSYKAAIFTCPHCETIIPAVFDPVAYVNDIAAGVVKALRHKPDSLT